MADPIITPAVVATVLTIVIQVTDLSETVYSWFAEPEEQCNTKVSDNPEQWTLRPCMDKEENNATTQTTSD